MDLIRLIKLKKINGDLDNLSRFEIYFLKYLDCMRTVKINSNTLGFVNIKENTIHIEVDLDSNEIWCYKDKLMPYMLKLNISVFQLDYYIHKFLVDRLKITKFKDKIYFI